MDEHVLPTYRRAEPVFVSGRGAVLIDEEGREYLDLLGGIAVSALGHAHPRLVEALRDQVGRVTHVSNLYRHPYTDAVAGRLACLSGMHATFFSNSGSEANECALKLARKAQVLRGEPGRTRFVALEGGFHGRTLGSLSITAHAPYREPFGPLLEASFVEPGDTEALAAALRGEGCEAPAALVLEPIQGEGGLRVLDPEYLAAARELCTSTGTLLIADEVQCGCGRTGEFLASQRVGLAPDIVTLAKPLGAGLPVGATLVCAELAETLQPGDHGSTFGGGPLVLRAVLTFLEELLENDLLEAVRARGEELTRGLDELVEAHPGVTERRGVGLMQGLRIPDRHAAVQAALFEHGVLTCTAGEEVVRFLPPYVIQPEELAKALEIVDTTLTQVLEKEPAS